MGNLYYGRNFVHRVLLALEGLLGLLTYQETGEISTFQIVIIIFVLYACTFGIYDFLKLDRWMRKKIGQWRGMELLTEQDCRIMERAKDPNILLKNDRGEVVPMTVFETLMIALTFDMLIVIMLSFNKKISPLELTAL